MLEKARLWLERAKADLKSAEVLMDIVPADSIYHSQQAVEKAIKSALVLKGIGQGAQSFRLILRRVRHSVPPA
ncbi:HEPN domain-containing protein [Archaeoglobus sp.]|uniref:HEPN domain-containing protein n=1 Tax=Archaeoglobus sp. TaxID=1872626 RepID=UPI0024AABE48|nr:HEPN domain-containing protein [Archaeoglobus sp.]MDI3496998.1 hypothetical protein [Archaeoglobus sp.]